MKITVWGARGSTPSPLKPQEIEEKLFQAIYGLPEHLNTNDRDAVQEYIAELPPLMRGTAGGNTSCVEIRTGEDTFIIDAGSGIRELGLELMKGPCGRGEGELHIFFSHAHWDHIQGFPFFVPAFIPGNRLFIYSIHPLEKALTEQQRPLNFPVSLTYMQADIQFIPIQEGHPFTVKGMKINTIHNAHPGVAYSFRFEDRHSVFVYANDAEYQNLDQTSIRPYLEFFKDADALVFDAQYTLTDVWQLKEDWGHSSAMIGVDMARRAGVKKLLLFHHDPTNTDAQLQEIQQRAIAYQTQDASLPFCEVLIAYEGLTLDLTPSSMLDLRLDKEAAVLTPTTTFETRSMAQLTQQLERLSQQDTSSTPIIDLSHVETLTTANLKSLIALQRKQGALQIVLAAPSEKVRQIIKLSGYLDFFAVYPSVKTALNAIQARKALNLPGQIIKGRYRIEHKLGEGRLGVVLKATDINLKRSVALKILSPSFGPETLDRFMRLAKQITTLDHPHIVKAFDWDEGDGFSFKVEELMEAPILQSLLQNRKTPLPFAQAMDIAIDITRALENAHSRGIIHGDLKPQNIFLTDKGAKLSGFSLGHLEEGRNLLEASLLFLTADYLAPEQIQGQPLNTQSDLYALGVLFYHLFVGRLPFEGDDQTVMQAHLHQLPPSPRKLNPRISFVLEHLILKLLAKDPDNRYASARQIRRILQGLLTGAGYQNSRYKERLVGRDKELAAIQSAWQKAQQGQGQLILISGDLGIGKTSLIRHAAAQSKAPVMLLGQGCQQERNRPFCLFSQVTQAYLSTISPEALSAKTRQHLSVLTPVIPNLQQLCPDISPVRPLNPKKEQERLLSSWVAFFKNAAQKRPWLVMLNDLHWADQSSLALLYRLTDFLPSIPMLIIGTYNPAKVGQAYLLPEILRNLQKQPFYHHRRLKALTQLDAQQLLNNIWKQPVPASLAQKIYQHTTGNPFFIKQVVKGMSDDGLISLENGSWRFPPRETVRLPESAREAVWRRIHHLNPDTQTLLRQAAVLGQTFNFDDLLEMSNLPPHVALEHLDTALARHLVQAIPDSRIFRFVHSEIHYVLYADIGPDQRRRLHQLAAQTLETRAQPNPDCYAEILTYHFIEADDLQKALAYSLKAARHAEALHANHTAQIWYTQTLEILDHLDPTGISQFQPIRESVLKSLAWLVAKKGRRRKDEG